MDPFSIPPYDLFWIGRLADGASAIAGVTVFLQVLWMLEILNEIIGMSSVSLISQSYGAGDLERTRTAIEQTLVFKALVALAAGCIGFAVLRPLVGFFTSDPRAASSALAYGRIRLLTLPLMFSSYTVNTALRNVGEARKPMLIMGASAVLNVVLDPLFMFGYLGLPALGIRGAAVSSVTSVAITFSVGLYLFYGDRTNVKLHFSGKAPMALSSMWKMVKIGIPEDELERAFDPFFRGRGAGAWHGFPESTPGRYHTARNRVKIRHLPPRMIGLRPFWRNRCRSRTTIFVLTNVRPR